MIPVSTFYGYKNESIWFESLSIDVNYIILVN